MPQDNRLNAQIQLITDNLEGAAAYPPDWRERGFVEYLYRQRTILTRLEDEAQVTDAILTYLSGLSDQEGGVRRRDGLIEGVVTIDLSPHPAAGLPEGAVPFVLDAVDRAVGRGKAKPDTVLYVASHPCPAKEPEPVAAGTIRPYPDPNDNPGCGCDDGGDGCEADHCRGQGVAVTVADMGLYKNAIAGHDWLDGIDGEPEDPFFPGPNGEIKPYGFHGLFVAANVRVTAPEATVYVEQDVVAAQAASGAVYEEDVTLKLENALQRDAKIIVFVFTASTREQLTLLSLDVLYERQIATRDDLVFLAPAGNEGQIDVQYPAGYPWAIAVGALKRNGVERAEFSNYGKWVDVFAVGEDLVNAFGTGTYTYTEPNVNKSAVFAGMAEWSGTSFSTPLVAGLIATRMSCKGESAPEAAEALLTFARSQRIKDVGPVIYPGQACR